MHSDFDFGNLIYVIAAIVAMFAGVFNKKKKPAGNKPQGQPQKTPNFLEKLEQQLTGFMGEEKVTASEEEFTFENDFEEEAAVVADPEVVMESPYASYEGMMNPNREKNRDLLSSEAIRSTESHQIMEVVDLDEEEGRDLAEIIENFDLGAAVIYSSILSRQEY